MPYESQIHCTTPLPFRPEMTRLYVAPPYEKDNDWFVDIQADVWEDLKDEDGNIIGCTYQWKKYTYPRDQVKHMIFYNPDTMQHEADWDAIAPLFNAKGINIGPAPVQP